jgi:hypothetical protein
VVVQLPHCYLLVLVELSHELGPVVHVHPLVCVGLEHFHLFVELDDEPDVVVLTIGHESLNGALRICGGHEDNISSLHAFYKLFFSYCVFFLVDSFFRLHESNFGRVNLVLYYTTYVMLPQLRLPLSVHLKNEQILKLIDSEGEGEVIS